MKERKRRICNDNSDGFAYDSVVRRKGNRPSRPQIANCFTRNFDGTSRIASSRIFRQVRSSRHEISSM